MNRTPAARLAIVVVTALIALATGRRLLGQQSAPVQHGGKQGEGVPKTYAKLKQELEAQGWVEVYEPMKPREEKVRATLNGAKRERVLKEGRLRYTPYVALPPIDIPAGQPKEIAFEVGRNKEVRRKFELSDGSERELRVVTGRLVIKLLDKWGPPYGYKVSPKPHEARKWVMLRCRVELLEGERVDQFWDLAAYDLAVFAKAVRPRKDKK